MILRLAVLVQCQLVTDGRTQDDSIYGASTELCDKNSYTCGEVTSL